MQNYGSVKCHFLTVSVQGYVLSETDEWMESCEYGNKHWFFKMQGISWLAEIVLHFQEELRSIELLAIL